jgi:hypothetical protein
LLGELRTEREGLGIVHVAERECVSIAGFNARQLPDESLPLALRRFKLGGPKSAGQRHFDRPFVGPMAGFGARASHREFAGRAPAEFYLCNLFLLPRFAADHIRRRIRGR